MNNYPSFYKNIRKFVNLSDEELEKFTSRYLHKKVEMNEVLLKEGEVCEFEGYAVEGCFKVFYKDENLREHILYFAIEDWWVLDIASFVSGNTLSLNIQALEDSVTLRIDRATKEQMYIDIPKVERLFRIMNQNSLAAMQVRMISMLHKNADRRYLDFIERYPMLMNRIVQHQIASYLGISHEFFSKLRKKILRNKK